VVVFMFPVIFPVSNLTLARVLLLVIALLTADSKPYVPFFCMIVCNHRIVVN